MEKKKLFYLLLFIIISSGAIYAQKQIPDHKYRLLDHIYSDSKYSMRLFAGATWSKFQSSLFSKKLASDVVAINTGYLFGLGWSIGAIEFDAHFAYNEFDSKLIPEDHLCNLFGIDVSASWNLLPSFEFFDLTTGLGYSMYSLNLKNNSETIERVKLRTPFVKLGATLYYSGYFLKFDYQQSFPLNDIKANSRINVILGIRLLFSEL